MRKPRILIYSYGANDGLVYQRAHLPLMHLRDKYDFVVRDVEDRVSHTDFFYCDAVVMIHPHNTVLASMAERIRYHYGKPLIVDLDDLVHDLPTDHPDFIIGKQSRVPQILQAATQVVYSTKYLAETYMHLNRNFTVIENTISKRIYETYQPATKPHKNAFIIGCTGGQSHISDHYNSFLPGLIKFMDEYEDAQCYFHVVCPDPLIKRYGSRVRFEPIPCDFLDYPAVSAAYPFSVALVGLTDCHFNNGKSDLKLLEMAPNDIPIIASPRADFIRHTPKGIMMYAEDNSDYRSWYDALVFAYENEDRMQEMSARAKEYVLAERLSDKAADKWDQVLQSAIKCH